MLSKGVKGSKAAVFMCRKNLFDRGPCANCYTRYSGLGR